MVEVASFRHVLNNRNFILLWLAQLISLCILQAANCSKQKDKDIECI